MTHKTNVDEAIDLLERADEDWDYLSGEERHGTVLQAIEALEVATETYQSPYEQKVDSIAVVLDEFPPMQILDAIQKLADDPDSRMHSGDVLTIASNLSTDEELESKIGLSETDESARD